MEQQNFNQEKSVGTQTNATEALPRPMMGLVEAVKVCFKKYIDFTGRARRSEYWWFAFFTFLLSMACSYVDAWLKGLAGVQFVDSIAALVVFLPSLAVSFRRLHDTGHSGWWIGTGWLFLLASMLVGVWYAGGDLVTMFNAYKDGFYELGRAAYHAGAIGSVPIVLWSIIAIAVLIFTLTDSQEEENKYGRSPKYQ